MSRHIYIGRSGMGKTHLLTNRLKNVLKGKDAKKYLLIIVSPTAPLQDLYKPLKKHTKYYFPTINERITNEITDIISTNFKKKKGKKTPLVVIDDLGENHFMKWGKKGNRLNHLVVTARHLGAHIIFLYQRMKQATTSVRDNADVVNCFRIDDKDQLKDFQKAFCSELPDETFQDYTQKAWKENYGYVKIERSDPNNKKYYIKEHPIDLNKKEM